jgi:hypothetical protein
MNIGLWRPGCAPSMYVCMYRALMTGGEGRKGVCVCMCEDWDGVTRGGGYFGLFGSVLGRGGSGRKVGMNGGVPGSDRLWMLFADVCGNGGSWARGDRRRETGEAIGNCVSWCVYSRFGNNGGLARCSVQYYGCLSLSYFRELYTRNSNAKMAELLRDTTRLC